MAAITLGREWVMKLGRKGRRILYKLNRHGMCFGPTRSGKGVCLEIPNLLRIGARRGWFRRRERMSIISIDPKGQNAAVTARWRKTVSDVLFLKPLSVLGLGSTGFNPLAALDPASPHFFLHASAIAEALVRIAESGDPFWSISARNLVLALVMWEVKCARAEVPARVPLLKNVRGMLTGDLPATATKIFNSGDFVLASLAGQFMEKNKTNDGIVATASSGTQWLLDQNMLDDLAKDGIDWAQLKTTATTVYVILPAHALETFSAWLRLVVACAFNALYRQENGGGLRTLFMLSEFAQLGKLSMVSAALAQGAGYGIQLFPVLQDINQLREIYGKDAANTFLGMCGATFAFTPNDPETAEWMSKRAGDIIIPSVTVNQSSQGDLSIGVRPERQRAVPPDDLFDIPDFHGLVFFAGQSAAQPAYAPPYWDRDGNPDLVGRYDPDPYHPGSSGGRPRILPRLLRATAGVAFAGLVVLGGAALLHPSGLQGLLPGFAPPVFHHPARW
jgi:type IV secretion system protein VirD4